MGSSKNAPEQTTSAYDNSANAGTNSTAESFSMNGGVAVDDGSTLAIIRDESTAINLRDDSMKTEAGGISVRGGKVDSTQQGDGSVAIRGKGKSKNAGRDITETTIDNTKTQAVKASGNATVTIQDGSADALALANNAVQHLKTAQLETINATRSTIERVTASAEEQSRIAIENLTDNKADPLTSNNIKVVLVSAIAGLALIALFLRPSRPSRSDK